MPAWLSDGLMLTVYFFPTFQPSRTYCETLASDFGYGHNILRGTTSGDEIRIKACLARREKPTEDASFPSYELQMWEFLTKKKKVRHASCLPTYSECPWMVTTWPGPHWSGSSPVPAVEAVHFSGQPHCTADTQQASVWTWFRSPACS
jgi:hypothetical protein